MEEARKIDDYLPISFADQNEHAYIRFLWDAFEANYNTEKYEFANLASTLKKTDPLVLKIDDPPDAQLCVKTR